MQKELIDQYLANIADLLKTKSTSVDNIGLLKGQTGIALFLFLYSQYTEDENMATFAGNMIDAIMNSIGDDTPTDYSDGLAGFGTAIEFLVQNGFIDADTDEVLEDLDTLVGNVIKQGSRRSEVIGYGKYLVARLADCTADKQSYARNKESLDLILKWLDKPLGSYSETMGAIEWLSDMYAIWDPEEITLRINKIIDGLEDAVCDDIRFGCYPSTFNPLVAALAILKASEKTGIAVYRNKALALLGEHGRDFVHYLGNDSSGLISGSFKWAVLYRCLSKQLSNEEYSRLADIWLERCLEKKELLTEGCAEMPVGALDGYAGLGLSLLDAVGGAPDNWTDIIPLYYERGKVTFTR
jgi:hypothetical protein